MADYQGLGTEEAPYLIEAPEQMRDAFQSTTLAYYQVIQNIDMNRMTMGGYVQPRSIIDGKGHVITNAGQGLQYLYVRFYGVLRNLHIQWVNVQSAYPINYIVNDDFGTFENVRFEFIDDKAATLDNFKLYRNRPGTATNLLVVIHRADASKDVAFCAGGGTLVDISDRATDAATYDSMDSSVWAVTDGAIPVLIPQGTDLSAYTQVHGTALMDGEPVQRRIRAVTADRHILVAETESAEDGRFTLPTTPYTSGVLVYTFDDYGTVLKPNTSYATDDITHPTVGNGYRYRCIQAGITDAELPPLPWSTTQLVSGTAVFVAEKFLQPVMHGPVTPVLIFGE